MYSRGLEASSLLVMRMSGCFLGDGQLYPSCLTVPLSELERRRSHQVRLPSSQSKSVLVVC